tara:strand:+ start:2073 stop:2933 length:861 start_codon:yes stop_codon:yes gene_type:complete
MLDNIGIVGCGFVGNAIKKGFNLHAEVYVYDKYVTEKNNTKSLKELVERADVLFICLPTPMKKTGECDISLVSSTVEEIDYLCKRMGYKKTVIIKSTVPPKTTEILNKKASNLDVIFNPEFLTEATPVEDFKNQKRIILGVDNNQEVLEKIVNLYNNVFPNTPVVVCSSVEAELIKYFCNCILAAKVSFSNEFYQLCSVLGANYKIITEAASYDKRIGNSHLNVPGPDGKYGFGGSCFPKDINSLIHIMRTNNISPLVTSAIWQKNLEVRPSKDWESLKGRAVVDD